MGKYGAFRGYSESIIGDTNSYYSECFKVSQYNPYNYL